MEASATLGPGNEPGQGARGGDSARLGKGTELGRYVVLRSLGAGAMGAVYLAYDPELDRKVALKLLHGGSNASRGNALLREAQAMAKLTHPNVVSVHDVGEHEGSVYIAMEFVEGRTLRRWLEAERRAWRVVLERFLAAGRGLEAAHQRGLVHRDFKPDNVMVADDGRVMVMDFGLARPRSGTSQPPGTDLVSSSRLTVATVGRVAGTPAYMAPEQAMAKELSPAADQFSFCVSLWEGICRERPFSGESFAELLRNVSEGRVRSPPIEPRMPRWLRRTLARGLRSRANERWPSMADLLAALERGRGRWRWQAGLAALVVVGVPIGLGAAKRQRRDREHQERGAACEAQGAAIEEVWDEHARARLRSGLLQTKAGFAQHSVDTLIPWLDDYTRSWMSGRTEACMHGSVYRDWDADLQDRSAWCFEDRKLQLEATVQQIAGGDAKAARRAVRLASYLDPVDACLEPEFLERLPLPPPEIRDEIRSIRATLTAADRLRHGGMYSDALEVARTAGRKAEALGWPPLRASARFVEGRCQFEAGHLHEGTTTLTNAYFEALDVGSVEVAFRAARSLVHVHSALQRYREAKVWARHAEAVSAGKVDPGGLDEAEGHYLLMTVYLGLGDYETAASEGEKALEQRAATLGSEHPITAAALRNLGRVYLAQERPREALEMIELSFAIWLDAVGRDHPHIGTLCVLRGQALLDLGRPEEALSWIREGLEIHETVYAADHPAVASNLDELGRVYATLGQLDEAERAHERAKTIRRDRLGPGHRRIAQGLLDVAVVDRMRGRFELAVQRCMRAREILEASLEPHHPEIAGAIEAIADVRLAQGRPEAAVERRLEALSIRESGRGPDSRQLITPLARLGDTQQVSGRVEDARQSYRRALEIAETVVGKADAAVVFPLVGLAEVALAEGDTASAVKFAERAVRIAVDQQVGPLRSSRAHFILARALQATGESESRARAAAERAREAYGTAHEAVGASEVDAWLRVVDTSSSP